MQQLQQQPEECRTGVTDRSITARCLAILFWPISTCRDRARVSSGRGNLAGPLPTTALEAPLCYLCASTPNLSSPFTAAIICVSRCRDSRFCHLASLSVHTSTAAFGGRFTLTRRATHDLCTRLVDRLPWIDPSAAGASFAPNLLPCLRLSVCLHWQLNPFC